MAVIMLRKAALEYKGLIYDFENYAKLNKMEHGNKRKFAAGYFQALLLCINRDKRINPDERAVLQRRIDAFAEYYRTAADI